MENSHFRLLIVVGFVCIGLLATACSNELPTPTQTQFIIPTKYPSTTPKPTLVATSTPTMSSSQRATEDARNSIIATTEAHETTEASVFPNCGWPSNRNYSPDGNWIAVECSNYGLGVYSADDHSKAWFFSYYDDFANKYGSNIHDGHLRVKHWSTNGQYLYIMPFFGGDGGCPAYYEGQALLSIELSTGEISDIVSPSDFWSYYNFSFSNDEELISYFETWLEHPVLKIRSFDKQIEIPIGNNYSGAGDLIWSQDNNQVLFSAKSGEECENLKYYLIVLNLKDRSQKVVLEGEDADKYQPIQWINENQVMLADYDYSTEIYYSLNLTTGEVSEYSQPAATAKP
jgi:hypothetical protein